MSSYKQHILDKQINGAGKINHVNSYKTSVAEVNFTYITQHKTQAPSKDFVVFYRLWSHNSSEGLQEKRWEVQMTYKVFVTHCKEHKVCICGLQITLLHDMDI